MKSNEFWPRKKVCIIFGIVFLYVSVGIVLFALVQNGVISRLPPTPIDAVGDDSIIEPVSLFADNNLRAAQHFVEKELVREDGHVFLYQLMTQEGTVGIDNNTNSEAVSYYLLWTAQAEKKDTFDRGFSFMEEEMLHPVGGYMQWRINEEGIVESDGGNIASDADLRAIKALLIAEKQWGDPQYTRMIETLAIGLENTAITEDGLLAPYGGMSGDTPWVAEESWLSYSDFIVFRELSERRGAPWTALYSKMKLAVLDAQLENGLYNSQLTEQRQYGNHIDGGGYSINSLWIMERSAESGDAELVASAQKSLEFYKQKYEQNLELDTQYSSNGDALSSGDAPWVYVLVGRAAVALDDEFSEVMIAKLIEMQIMDCSSPHHGAFPEGVPGKSNQERVGQFTMQEAILTLQAYVQNRGGSIESNNGYECEE